MLRSECREVAVKCATCVCLPDTINYQITSLLAVVGEGLS
jgi:hypothetical protein